MRDHVAELLVGFLPDRRASALAFARSKRARAAWQPRSRWRRYLKERGRGVVSCAYQKKKRDIDHGSIKSMAQVSAMFKRPIGDHHQLPQALSQDIFQDPPNPPRFASEQVHPLLPLLASLSRNYAFTMPLLRCDGTGAPLAGAEPVV